MLEPESIRGNGERLSFREFDGGSSGDRSELAPNCGVRTRGLLVTSKWFGTFGKEKSGGCADGNWKLCENDAEAFLFGCPIEGVFGAVEAICARREGRVGMVNSFKGSCIVGDEEPITGEAWMGDLKAAVPVAKLSALKIYRLRV